MKPATATFIMFIVIVLCGYVVSHAQGTMKMAAFMVGIAATGICFYLYWRER